MAAGPVELSWLESFHSKIICASKSNSGCGWMVFIKLWTMKMKKDLLKLTSPNHRDLCIASAPPPRNPLTCLAATDSCPSIAFPSTFAKPAQRKGCLFSIFSTNPLSTSTWIFTWHRGWEMMLSTKGTMLVTNDVTRRTCLTNVDL